MATTQQQTSEFLTAQELAGRLKVSVSLIRKQTSKGLPHIKLGRATRYSLSSVLAHLQARNGNGTGNSEVGDVR